MIREITKEDIKESVRVITERCFLQSQSAGCQQAQYRDRRGERAAS